jgi:hypothetical protein
MALEYVGAGSARAVESNNGPISSTTIYLHFRLPACISWSSEHQVRITKREGGEGGTSGRKRPALLVDPSAPLARLADLRHLPSLLVRTAADAKEETQSSGTDATSKTEAGKGSASAPAGASAAPAEGQGKDSKAEGQQSTAGQ